jgi:hypothetical protein
LGRFRERNLVGQGRVCRGRPGDWLREKQAIDPQAQKAHTQD